VLEDTDPNATTSSVVTSPIGPGAVTPGPPAAKPSPLRALRATAGDYPDRIMPGHLLKFVVTLANLTDAAVFLTVPPPPSYAIGAYCARTPARLATSSPGRIRSTPGRGQMSPRTAASGSPWS
jgi:hypothetical protein